MKIDKSQTGWHKVNRKDTRSAPLREGLACADEGLCSRTSDHVVSDSIAPEGHVRTSPKAPGGGERLDGGDGVWKSWMC